MALFQVTTRGLGQFSGAYINSLIASVVPVSDISSI